MESEAQGYIIRAMLGMLDKEQRDELLANLEKLRPVNPDPTNTFRVGLNRAIHAEIDAARHLVMRHAKSE